MTPIFIHSLFRSGSTYFFHVFRRSPADYRCFQEALHYVIFYNKDNPEKLNRISEENVKRLRHPNLEKPYFYELLPIWPAWKDKLTYSAIFDGYFGAKEADNGIEFFKAIIDATPDARPVFEECRTTGRIGLYKKHLGGFHIYLWRNPWDQWWSYKTTNSFDYQNRMIINAPNTLKSIAKLRSFLKSQKIYEEAPYTWDGVFSAEESYLTYYLLWCLALHEAIKHADLLINIDELTKSKAYCTETLHQLAENNIKELDFSDCKIPQGTYFEDDMYFFHPLEEKVHGWLREDLPEDELHQIQHLRERYQPDNLYEDDTSEKQNNLARQIVQIRAVSRRFETDKANYLQKYLESRDKLEKKSEQEKELIASFHNSYSWRLTRPLRWISDQIKTLKK